MRVTVAFYLPGKIPVYLFSLLISFGIVTGITWSYLRCNQGYTKWIFPAAIWSLTGSFIGGKAGYLGVNWEFYRSNPGYILDYLFGGLTWPGNIIGGLFGLLIFAWVYNKNVFALMDSLVPLLFSVVTTAWLGCWVDGCAYGHVDNRWFAVPSVDEWGNLVPRWPVQIVGAITALVLSLLLDIIRQRKWLKRIGQYASLAMFGLGLEFWGLSSLRADTYVKWNDQRLDSVFALFIAGLSVIGFLIAAFQPKESDNNI